MCDTPSHDSDHLWLIWKESIQTCRCYRADTAAGTDGRTDGRSETNIPPNLFGGYKNINHAWWPDNTVWRCRPVSTSVAVFFGLLPADTKPLPHQYWHFVCQSDVSYSQGPMSWYIAFIIIVPSLSHVNSSDAGDGILRLLGFNTMPADVLAPDVARASAVMILSV